jgi:hypothetical protein
MNMRRLDPSALALRSQTLAYDTDGRLVPNGGPDLARHYAFAMAAPTPSSTQSTGMAALVDCEVKKILEEGHTMAQSILEEHLTQLQRLADALLEREQLNRAEFEALMQE